MSDAQQSLSKNDPRMVAWEDYKLSSAYANSFKWAQYPEHRDGSMWAAFLQGFDSAITAERQRRKDKSDVYRPMPDADLVNEIALLFGDSMSVRCDPTSYAEQVIRLVRASSIPAKESPTGTNTILSFDAWYREQDQEFIGGSTRHEILQAAFEAGARMHTAPADHKWFDPECGASGCQSLVWKGLYESAVDDRLNDHRRAGTDPTQHNMDFIEHAREDIPALIAEVKRLREENERAWKSFSDAIDYAPGQREAAGRYGFEPGYLQHAWRMGERHDESELEYAIIDALGVGCVSAHPGDGVGCAAHIVGFQLRRAVAAEDELTRLRSAIAHKDAALREAFEFLNPEDSDYRTDDDLKNAMAVCTAITAALSDGTEGAELSEARDRALKEIT